jgi:hypothetical protein
MAEIYSCNSWQGKSEPITVGISIFSRVSSVSGSPSLSYLQPLINSRLFSSTGVLIGAQILFLLAKYIFKLDSVPRLDLANNQIVQIPLGELQSLLQLLATKQKNIQPSGNLSGAAAASGTTPLDEEDTFPTNLPPEAPVVISLFITADYSNQLYTPTSWFYVPILSFPGLRGSLPILILSTLGTILVRCVVPPESTGAKPIPEPSEQPNSSLNLRPEELLGILNRFGKYFRPQ